MAVQLTGYVNAPDQPESATAVPAATLTAGIDASTTTIPVSSVTYLPPSSTQFVILIGTEKLLVTSRSSLNLTATRGVEGTTAASHLSAANVWNPVTAASDARNPGPMTAAGDFVYLDANGAPTRLAAPSNGDYSLRWTSSVPSYVAAPSATVPGGLTTQIQFNNAGAFGGSANLVWDGSTLKTAGALYVGSLTPSTIVRDWAGDGDDAIIARSYEQGTIVTQQGDGTFSYPNFGYFNALTYLNATFNPPLDDPDNNFYSALQIQAEVPAANTSLIYDAVGLRANVVLNGGHGTYAIGIESNVTVNAPTVNPSGIHGLVTVRNTAGIAIGFNGGIVVDNAAVVNEAISFYATLNAQGASHINTATNIYLSKGLFGGATVDHWRGIWAPSFADVATNVYYVWFDSQGVYRIREDNVADTASFPQAVEALYNPRFTKYTAGAVNFERGVNQWVSNVWTITTEAGGTGTLRAMNLGATGVQVQVNGKNLTLSGNLTTTGSFNPTFAIPSSSTWTFPSGGGALLAFVQGASVADATDAPSAITQLNALISRIEALGLIATV